MARTVIGVCAELDEVTFGRWRAAAAFVPRSYVAALHNAGALALILPVDAQLTRDPDEALELLDGLLLVGGTDLEPASYGAQRDPNTGRNVPERDAYEIALARRAIELDVPLLAICRGMQVLNVALGGTLHQHLPDVLGHGEHMRTPGSYEDADHDVRLEPGSLAARVAGEELHRVKSHHHQGVDRLGEGLRVTGWSTLDELPEAIEAPAARFALGVQWHPEADERSGVLAALVRGATERRAAQAGVGA